MRVRTYAVTFAAITKLGVPDTYFAKGRGAEDALRRLLGVLSQSTGAHESDIAALVADEILMERVVPHNSSMDEPYAGSLPLTQEYLEDVDKLARKETE